MEKLVRGDVVVLPFPFSDLSAMKKRPAVIVATLQGDDVICCQITSEARFDNYSINLSSNDFKEGGLQIASMIRPNRIFTADKSIISYKAVLPFIFQNFSKVGALYLNSHSSQSGTE